MREYQEEGSLKEFRRLIKIINNATDERSVYDSLQNFYKTYSNLIKAFLLARCTSQSINEQAINEVIKAVWDNRKSLKHMRKPFSWLKTVTIRKQIDELRKEKNEYPLDDRIPDRSNLIDKVEEDCAYLSMIENLSSIEKEIVTDKVLSDATFKEIAADKGMPIPTVASIFYRALDKIRENLQEK